MEVLDRPSLRGAPLIVGADPQNGNGRGVVSTCSYEARDYGLHSGMPISKAYNLCPHGVYLRPHHKRYKEVSKMVKEVIKQYSENFQSGGIDEAYLDVSDYITDFKEALIYAKSLQEKVSGTIGVSCSIGISYTKSLAKIASDCQKPKGITVITPRNRKKVLDPLKITRIPGIGKRSKQRYYRNGLYKIQDLLRFSKRQIFHKFGKQGLGAWKVAKGLDRRPVKEVHKRKSIGKERTFRNDTKNEDEVVEKLDSLNQRLHQYMKKYHIIYKTMNIKIRFRGFKTYTRAFSFTGYVCNSRTSFQKALDLLEEFYPISKPIRLIGIRFTNLKKERSFQQMRITDYVNPLAA